MAFSDLDSSLTEHRHDNPGAATLIGDLGCQEAAQAMAE
jgi:hypothetical protein